MPERKRAAWSYIGNGSVWIYFYINDSVNEKSYVREVRKDIIGPNITILTPDSLTVFGQIAPTVSLNIIEPHLNFTEYQLYNTTTWSSNYSIPRTGGPLDQATWSTLISNGFIVNGTLLIRVYAHDIGDNLNYTDITIRIDLIKPIVEIDAPIVGTKWEDVPPIYSLTVTEPNIAEIWYTFDGGQHNYSVGVVIEGAIPESVWSTLPNGQLTLRFYVRDKGENLGYDEILIAKEATVPPPPDDGLPFWLQAAIAGAISGSVGIALRIVYSKVKKRRERTKVAR